MITLFSGDSSPGGCASVTPWLVELKVDLSVFTFLLSVKPFFKKAFDDFFSSKQMN